MDVSNTKQLETCSIQSDLDQKHADTQQDTQTADEPLNEPVRTQTKLAKLLLKHHNYELR